jgi:ATP-dependent Clp protease ATP-binding subunit ClpC
MTSNLGARIIEKATPLGFHKEDGKATYEKIKDNVLSELKKTFNPEFLNRIDEAVVFHPLDKEHLYAIIDLLIEETNKQIVEQEIAIELNDKIKQWLVEKYYNPAYGARPMRRAIQKEIEDPLSELLIKGKFKEATRIRVRLEDDKPVFEGAEDTELLPAGMN